jgi:hypothetical protein
MIPMKKLFSFILAVVLVFAMSMTAAGADSKKKVVGEYEIYDYQDGWWYDYGDPEGTYHFDKEEKDKVKYAYAEAMSKAEGLAALYHLIDRLEASGMYLMSYEVVKQKTANHVYYIEVMNQYGQIWSCYYFTFTHEGVDSIMNAMMNGSWIKYYSIFMTTYVNGQKIKNYADNEKITGFDVKTDDAIDAFIQMVNYNYDYYYNYFFGDNYSEPDWWFEGVG